MAISARGGDTSTSEREEPQRADEPSTGGRRWRWPGAATTPASPTSPAQYALLEAAFLGALGTVVALTRRRERTGEPAIPRAELPVLALATFALSDVLAKEKISTWLREPFVFEDGDHKPVSPEGDGLRYAIGELITCTRCVGTWSALALVGLRTASPSAGRATATVLALAGINDVAQSGFRLLAERTNRAIIETSHAEREVEAGA